MRKPDLPARNVILLFMAAAFIVAMANMLSCARNPGHDMPTHSGLAL